MSISSWPSSARCVNGAPAPAPTRALASSSPCSANGMRSEPSKRSSFIVTRPTAGPNASAYASVGVAAVRHRRRRLRRAGQRDVRSEMSSCGAPFPPRCSNVPSRPSPLRAARACRATRRSSRTRAAKARTALACSAAPRVAFDAKLRRAALPAARASSASGPRDAAGGGLAKRPRARAPGTRASPRRLRRSTRNRASTDLPPCRSGSSSASPTLVVVDSASA